MDLETHKKLAIEAFNKTLLKYYQANPNKTMEEYYDFILGWSEKQ